jgi:hypothetical protein
MLTLNEFKEKIIEQVPEVDLIDILNLTTQDLVRAFSDEIEEKYDAIIKLLEVPDDQGELEDE